MKIRRSSQAPSRSSTSFSSSRICAPSLIMKFLALAALASLASSISIELSKRESPLDVKLEMTGNTELKASVTNTGSEDLKVLKTGSFLDETAVEKVEVFQGSKFPRIHALSRQERRLIPWCRLQGCF